ncbi:MAG: acetate/propionate family kinase [Candidatus Acididesulfobacter guangdongensis]|uniref:Acetate kinase n=1 Tax=Acididesulfobacter guangdongensis TaxID=2597225 RepID=A0A519BJK4_ACIG2|nr:MAG: acetate/propionate family kinase [Candidatus Acididesulfobacter guangdongensis]
MNILSINSGSSSVKFAYFKYIEKTSQVIDNNKQLIDNNKINKSINNINFINKIKTSCKNNEKGCPSEKGSASELPILLSLNRLYDGEIEEIGTSFSSYRYENADGKKSGKTNFANHHDALFFIINKLIYKNINIDIDNKDEKIDVVVHRFVHGGNVFIKPLVIKPVIKPLEILNKNKLLKNVKNSVSNSKSTQNITLPSQRNTQSAEIKDAADKYDNDTGLHINFPDLKKLAGLNELAPLHNPSNLLGLKTTIKLIPEAAEICIFDTSFHSAIPDYASIYPLPIEYYEQHKIKKYGFHGISYAFISNILKLSGYKFKKMILCHLGNGASIAAVKNGKSIDTSMGYTPLEGLMMGTRTGDVDPSLSFILKNKLKLSEEELYNIYNKKSGLLGISQKTYDVKELLTNSDYNSKLAIKMFCYRIVKYIGAYSAALNGIDALIFSGGIGENSSFIRQEICKNLSFLGIKLNKSKNNGVTKIFNSRSKLQSLNITNSMIKISSGKTIVLAVKTDEELMMAENALKILKVK